MKAPYISETLSTAHVLATFACGRPELDTWLKGSATHAQAMRTARTFVWHRGDGEVVAYFSLAAHLVRRAELPRRVARGAPDTNPAILLARLALDGRLQGQGLGAELLWDALSRCVAAADIAGARVVVVDALDESAAAFYSRFGFQPTPPQPMRLVQKLSDIAEALRA